MPLELTDHCTDYVDFAPYVLERYGEKFDPMTGTGDIETWIAVRGRSSR